MTGKGIAAAVAALALTLTAGAGARPRGKADLVEKRISPTPAQVAPGASFTVTDVVMNRGARMARASATRYYLRNVGASILVGVRRVPALKPHRSSRAQARLTVPEAAPAAVFALVACVDATRSVAETNERNNCHAATARLSVTRPVAPPPATTTTTTTTTAVDSDHDGFTDTADCGPSDASIRRLQDRALDRQLGVVDRANGVRRLSGGRPRAPAEGQKLEGHTAIAVGQHRLRAAADQSGARGLARPVSGRIAPVDPDVVLQIDALALGIGAGGYEHGEKLGRGSPRDSCRDGAHRE